MLRIDGLRSTVELGMIDVERIDRGDGYWFLDTGVPHYVEFTDDLEAVDVIGRGRGYATTNASPKAPTSISSR